MSEIATEAFSATRDDDGILAGPVRHPRNLEQAITGSIHEDATAQKLGLRGGTVAGSLHMEQFPPLLTAVFGDRWWNDGGLSLYFTFATTDLEGVRCLCKADGGAVESVQLPVWMDRDDGQRVAEGTAWVGSPSGETPLEKRVRSVPPPQDLRVFADLEAGESLAGIPVRVPEEDLERRLSVIVEPLEIYRSEAEHGGRVLPPSLEVRAMTAFHHQLLEGRPNLGVGLYGAIETWHLAGPLLVEHDYEVRGKVLAVGETPKTEYFWYESTISEPAGGEDRARMLMMLRFMKASSPLWQ